VPAPYSGSTTTNADGSITRIQAEFTPAAYATHDATGVPANCAALVDAWTSGKVGGGQWLTSAAAEITQPSGGLYGLSNILNNSDAAAYGVEAAAIADFWASNTAGTAHSDPGNLLPSLASGDAASLVPNAGTFYALGFAAGREIDAVSSLFMAEDIANDVMTNADLSGETDWVVTFPTRRYYVNGTAPADAPFTDMYEGVTIKDASGNITTQGAPNSSCEAVVVTPYDREESASVTPPGQPIFSPAPAPGTPTALPSLCYETNTIAVNGVSAVNATVSTDTVLAAAISLANANGEGWQVIGFNETANPHKMGVDSVGGSSSTGTLDGLPVMGFAAFEYTNATSNFGFVAEHKTSVGGSAIGGLILL
jgi:hypothetical protein